MGSRPVFQYELNGTFVTEYPSISIAAKAVKCNEATIRKALDKDRARCGFRWYSGVQEYKLKNTTRPRRKQYEVSNKYIEQPEIIENLIKYGTEYNPKDVAFNACKKLIKNKLKEKINELGNSEKSILPIDVAFKPGEVEGVPVVNFKFNSPDPKHVKILLIDIETAPVKALVWKMWKENIGVDQVLSDWFCLTWAAKWLGESEVFSNKLTPEEVLIEDDKRIIKEMWKLFDDADIVIGHNSKNFDVVKLNTRFVIHGLVPSSPYKQVDTLEVARKEFGFSSNKLQHLANSFGIKGKYDTSFNLWKKCLEGDKDSLYYMEHYNKHDVEILELVYLKLRPYIKGHPNLDMYFNDITPHCPICGKHNLILVPDKNFYTQAVEYQVYRCEDCGGLSRAKKGNKILNKKVISAIPR
jgi:hypothetical protein